MWRSGPESRARVVGWAIGWACRTESTTNSKVIVYAGAIPNHTGRKQ